MQMLFDEMSQNVCIFLCTLCIIWLFVFVFIHQQIFTDFIKVIDAQLCFCFIFAFECHVIKLDHQVHHQALLCFTLQEVYTLREISVILIF